MDAKSRGSTNGIACGGGVFSAPLRIAVVDADAKQADELACMVQMFCVAWREASGVHLPLVRKREESALRGGSRPRSARSGSPARSERLADPEGQTFRASGEQAAGVTAFEVVVLASVAELERLLVRDQPDILCINIELGAGENGIQAVRRLLPLETTTQVVYTTASGSYHAAAYATHHAGFLVKPVTSAQVQQALQSAVQELFLQRDRLRRTRPLCLKHAGALYLVSPQDIVYAESHGRTLTVHVANKAADAESITVAMTLEQLKHALPDTFAQCHKSFLVNLAYVVKFAEDGITLKTGALVPVSQRKRAAVLRLLYRYGRVM